jgi:aspartate kinase
MMKLVVMKFGGTSIGSAERILHVADITKAAGKKNRIIVVVSAMAAVTDLLVSAAMHASHRNKTDLDMDLAQLEDMHRQAVKGLMLSKAAAGRLEKVITEYLAELHTLLDSVCALGELTPRAHDLIVTFGERLSVQLVSAALFQAGAASKPMEATKLIVTDDNFGDARPLLEESAPKARRILNKILDKQIVPVVTGFMGATQSGLTTTLGRGGSDYSATILGYCLDADEVWIYTDVDGAMTADPRIIPEARTISALSYEEAAELSYFGAKVLHPLTMVPAAMKNIPIRVKNTFSPKAPGTRIARHVNRVGSIGEAISSMNRLSLITVQGRGMSGVPGVAAKVFGAIAAQNINVLLISQASSEYNICFVIKHDDGQKAAAALRSAFKQEMLLHNIDSVKLEENLAILSVIGEGLQGRPGAVGIIFDSLGKAGVNIVAIAQGSSELNVSLVIRQPDVPVAVQSVHNVIVPSQIKETEY